MRINHGTKLAPIKKHMSVSTEFCVCVYGAYRVCIDKPCARHEGRVAICLTANLQRSGEWDQTGGKITSHTPK